MASLIELLGLPFLVGLVLSHVIPLVAGAVVGRERGEWLARVYTSLAMNMVGTGLFVWKNPSWRLKKAVLDPDVNEYRISFKGEPRHFADPLGLMSRLGGRPCGIAHADSKIIVTPREADIAGEWARLKSEDDWEIDAGDGVLKRAYFDLQEATATVNIDDVLKIFQGSAGPASVEHTKKIVELAQSVWNTTNYVDYGIWMVSMGAPFAMGVIASRLQSSGATSNLGEGIGLMAGVGI